MSKQYEHLTNEKRKCLDSIKFISKDQFDKLYQDYKNTSHYRIMKDKASSYTPTAVSSYFFSQTPTDFLLGQVNDIHNSNLFSKEQKLVMIANKVKNFICSRENYEQHDFCKYLVKNIGILAQFSETTEAEIQEQQCASKHP